MASSAAQIRRPRFVEDIDGGELVMPDTLPKQACCFADAEADGTAYADSVTNKTTRLDDPDRPRDAFGHYDDVGLTWPEKLYDDKGIFLAHEDQPRPPLAQRRFPMRRMSDVHEVELEFACKDADYAGVPLGLVLIVEHNVETSPNVHPTVVEMTSDELCAYKALEAMSDADRLDGRIEDTADYLEENPDVRSPLWGGFSFGAASQILQHDSPTSPGAAPSSSSSASSYASYHSSLASSSSDRSMSPEFTGPIPKMSSFIENMVSAIHKLMPPKEDANSNDTVSASEPGSLASTAPGISPLPAAALYRRNGLRARRRLPSIKPAIISDLLAYCKSRQQQRRETRSLTPSPSDADAHAPLAQQSNHRKASTPRSLRELKRTLAGFIDAPGEMASVLAAGAACRRRRCEMAAVQEAKAITLQKVGKAAVVEVGRAKVVTVRRVGKAKLVHIGSRRG